MTIVISGVVAQQYTTPFGQNRIQYKNTNWYYYSTNNFNVHYYPSGHDYALETIDFLEEEFQELIDKIGYASYNKIEIFIYNSIHDFQQSNIGIDGEIYTIGGRTEFTKLQLEIAYPGQAYQFKKDLLYKLSHTLISDMLYGGNLAEVFQNSYLLSLPTWFIDGAARYIAYGWSKEMDDYVRDYMWRKKIKKLKQIDGESAAIIGQSIWNYIAVQYGERNISNILNLTRIIRKEENSISNTLGVSFKPFLNDWQNFYLLQNLEVEKNYVKPTKNQILNKIRNSKNLVTSSISFNKDADKVAYATIKNGKYQVYVTNLQSKETNKIVSGGYRINGQEIDDHLPLIDWQDEYTLGIILFKRGFLYLNTFNLETGKKKQKSLTRFRQIESFSFNDNGRLVVISGDIDGQNDIFLTAMNRNALRRVTRDVYTDLDPVFIPGTAAIVFSSNRQSDSTIIRKVSLETLDNTFNLFIYDLDTTTTNFFKITNSYGENRKPYAKNVDEIYYLSDQQGIMNLYKYDLYNSINSQITNFDKSILSYDLHFDPDKFTFLMLNESKEKIYLDLTTDLHTNKFTLETPRKRVENASRIISQVLQNVKEEPYIEPEKEQKEVIDTDNFVFENENTTADSTHLDDPSWIDTDNYVFEEDTNTSVFEPESFFSKYFSFDQETERIGPLPYNPKFTFNNVITSFLWDPYRSFMLFLEFEINDILENYKIKGGTLVKPDLSQGDLFAEFHYLKYWMDFKARIDKKIYILGSQSQNNPYNHKYQLNKFKLTASLPVTHTFRVEVSPFYTETSFTNLNHLSVTNQSSSQAKNNKQKYFGGNFSLIFDNTIEKSFNIYHGTRALFEVNTHLHTSDPSKNFSNLRLEVRHYQKIHREIVWANRLFYGKQLGPNRKAFMLGGMDNWLFASSDVESEQDPLYISSSQDNSDILFNEFVTNLRGLDYNEAYGSDVLIFNSELRIPLFLYLTNESIKSNFLRNFQIIAFADMGAVWTGTPPFKDGQPIIRKFDKVPFSAEIVKYQNPWLGGFGFGVRTVLFGYYIKFDVAKPYIDGEIRNQRYYFTLGLDF